ncbi:MAG: CocE/NonD family hydrolase [Thermoplasmatota archaeon]
MAGLARALPALFALASLLAAGCLAPATTVSPQSSSVDNVSLPTHRLAGGQEVFLTMKDGVKIDNWVFRPIEPGRYPVIIESRPYFGNLDPPAQFEGQKFSAWLIAYFVPRGYVVVLNSVRGTGNSGGCYGQGGVTEQTDLAAVVEDFAAMNYSNGKVAMIGKSYGGTTPWEAAVQDPPNLTTIVPIAGITNWYDYLYTNGASMGDGPFFNTEYPLTISFAPYLGFEDPNGPTVPIDPSYAQKVCKDTVDLTAEGVQSSQTGDETAWWLERDYGAQIAKLNRGNFSVYIVHGLQDWNVKTVQIQDIFNQLTVPRHMTLGQWDHQYPLRTDWDSELLRWFDYWLKGIQNGIMDEPPVQVLDSTGVWHDEQNFPPTRAVPLALSLTQNGGLATGASASAPGTLSYVATPTTQANNPAPGPDQLVFSGASPNGSLLRVSGTPRLYLNATVDGPNTQFVATLYDVNGSNWTAINWAALDARHREGVTQSQPITPGQSLSYALRFYPMDFVLHPGHKLGLTIAGAGGFVMSGPTEAKVDIATGGGNALVLPTLPNIQPESPQPAMANPADLPWTS